MFRKLFQSKARKDVEVSMDYLLNFSHQNLVRAFFKTYPGFNGVIAKKNKDGIDPVPIAVELLAIGFAHVIETSRFTVSERMAIENYGLGHAEDGTDFAKAVRAFLFNCLRQKDIKKIDDHLYLYAVTEVVGALRGLNSDERSKRRVLSALDEALFPRNTPEA